MVVFSDKTLNFIERGYSVFRLQNRFSGIILLEYVVCRNIESEFYSTGMYSSVYGKSGIRILRPYAHLGARVYISIGISTPLCIGDMGDKQKYSQYYKFFFHIHRLKRLCSLILLTLVRQQLLFYRSENNLSQLA